MDFTYCEGVLYSLQEKANYLHRMVIANHKNFKKHLILRFLSMLFLNML